MQGRADGTRTPSANRPAGVPARGGRSGPARAAAWPAIAPAGPDEAATIPTATIERIQREAGNRAVAGLLGGSADSRTDAGASPAGGSTVQRLTVQRALSVEQAEAVARRLEDAMSGWGTDEEAIFGALSGRTAMDIVAIREAYQHLFSEDLDAELADELSGSELARARRLMSPRDEAAMTPVEEAVSQVGRWREVAAHLVEAMEGWGTEEDEIFNALEGRSPSEIEAIRTAYMDLTGHPLEVDLRDEMSGSELRRALNLLNARAAGEFTNEIEQNMTEGGTTVVKGRFNWTLREDVLEVDVPVKFRPDQGVPLPLTLWNGQIDSTWNQFAVSEPGGRKVEIKMALRDDQGDDRTIRVVQNTVPGSYGHPDRANAGKWYPIMPANTAPHEFGHLIGLQDEYQRTHGDFRRITGEDRTGPANASGKTEAAIATELHTALHGDDVTTRAPAATTVLVNCGLIAGGRPQQGDFAQAVMAAYDDAHGNLFSDLQGLPSGTNWTLMTVFSYASGTVMGNAAVVGVQPHEHPVMDRHLREFAAIIRRGYPSYEWTIGPK